MGDTFRGVPVNGRFSGRKAFTLIELLVVIAIIAILASILFPVFARARENARRSSCQSNQKQLALGMLQYLQDYDSRFPGLTGSVALNSNDISGPGVVNDGMWGNKIYPYVKSMQLYKCPSAKSAYALFPSTYAMNAMIACGAVGGQYTQWGPLCGGYGVNESIVDKPAQTIMLLEEASGYDQATTSSGQKWLGTYTAYQLDGDYISGYGFNGQSYGNEAPYFRQIHLQGENMAFVDGHVKWISEGHLLTLGVTVPYAGYKNGAKNGAVLYRHNGDIDLQPVS